MFLSAVGSQDSLLEITFRSTIPPVICDPTTPKPEVTMPPLGSSDGTSNAFSSSNGTLGSPLGRGQCLFKPERFRFLPGPPGPPPRLPSPPAALKATATPEEHTEVVSRDGKPLSCVDFAGFRESGIASEYESNSDDSDDRDEDDDYEIFGWGTDAETVRLLNVLNRQGTPDCLGDEIAV